MLRVLTGSDGSYSLRGDNGVSRGYLEGKPSMSGVGYKDCKRIVIPKLCIN